MRILVTGGRDFTDRERVVNALKWVMETCFPPYHLIHGGARGLDTIAGEVALSLGWTVEVHPAKWKEEGKAAGHLRNQRMVDLKPDRVLIFPGGRGTFDCTQRVVRAGLPFTRV